MAHRFLISQDSPVLYITVVTKDRLPVFRTDQMKEVLCRAIDEARKSAGFLLFAYVIMIDHMHKGHSPRKVVGRLTAGRSPRLTSGGEAVSGSCRFEAQAKPC